MIEHPGLLLLAYSSIYTLGFEFCPVAVTISYLSSNFQGMNEWLIDELIDKGQQNVGGK